MAVIPDPFEEFLRFNTFDPVLSCWIDIGQDENIRIIKGRQKILETVSGFGYTDGVERPPRSSSPNLFARP